MRAGLAVCQSLPDGHLKEGRGRGRGKEIDREIEMERGKEGRKEEYKQGEMHDLSGWIYVALPEKHRSQVDSVSAFLFEKQWSTGALVI